MNLAEVGREVQLLLPGRCKYTHPVSLLHSAGQIMVRRIPPPHQVLKGSVYIVKVQGEKTARHSRRFPASFMHFLLAKDYCCMYTYVGYSFTCKKPEVWPLPAFGANPCSGTKSGESTPQKNSTGSKLEWV